MNLLPWNGVIRRCRPGAPRDGGRRPVARRKPLCEALDNRRLLSTVAALVPGPSAAAVESAAETLNALDPTAFVQFQSDLASAESQSRVTSAEVRKLTRDEKIIDQTIESYSPDANTASTVLDAVQTDVDNAFVQGTLPASSWGQEQQALSQLLDSAVPNVHVSTFVIRDLIDQMKVVARAAGGTSELDNAVAGDRTTLSNDLGSTSNANSDTGSAGLDPLEVYYEGHVNGFIK
jgi:hypothetical protein